MASDYHRDRPVRMTPLHRTLSEAVRSSTLSYQQMSIATGLKRATISEMINGRVRGSLESWQKLLDVANVQIGWKNE